jgi:ABC-type spermidine/putrescine transport system permease subunit I
MVKGSTKAKELKFQYWISNIIKIYAFLVILANVGVLAYGF